MCSALYTKTVGNGTNLILLHGWAIHSGIWKTFIPSLTQHFRITVVDLPGFGKSPMLEKEYSLTNIIHCILEEVPAPAIWLGWSLGGLITLAAAIKYPQMISKIFIIAGSPKFIASHDWPGLSFSSLQQFGRSLQEDYDTTLSQFITLQLLHSEHAQEVKCLIKAALQHGAPSLAALIKSFKIIQATDLRYDLKKIVCPAHYIFGRSDGLVPYKISEKIPLLHPNAQVSLIRHAGHAPFLSHREEIVELIKPAAINDTF